MPAPRNFTERPTRCLGSNRHWMGRQSLIHSKAGQPAELSERAGRKILKIQPQNLLLFRHCFCVALDKQVAALAHGYSGA